MRESSSMVISSVKEIYSLNNSIGHLVDFSRLEKILSPCLVTTRIPTLVNPRSFRQTIECELPRPAFCRIYTKAPKWPRGLLILVMEIETYVETSEKSWFFNTSLLQNRLQSHMYIFFRTVTETNIPAIRNAVTKWGCNIAKNEFWRMWYIFKVT